MLFVCCFCDKACDDTLGQAGGCQWQEMDEDHQILSYTCCYDCLRGNPHAIAFRRRNQSHPSA